MSSITDLTVEVIEIDGKKYASMDDLLHTLTQSKAASQTSSAKHYFDITIQWITSLKGKTDEK